MNKYLNEQEQMLVRDLANKRYKSNRQHRIKNKKIGPQSNEETDRNGVGAEMAVAKFLNLELDTSTSPRSGGCDLISKKGNKIDVKHTKYKNGKLIATLNKKLSDADIYILCTGSFPDYEIKGWVKNTDLINEKNIKDLGYGPTYALEQEQLNKFKRE